MSEPAYKAHKEAIRQDIASAVEAAVMKMGDRIQGIDWFPGNHGHRQVPSGN